MDYEPATRTDQKPDRSRRLGCTCSQCNSGFCLSYSPHVSTISSSRGDTCSYSNANTDPKSDTNAFSHADANTDTNPGNSTILTDFGRPGRSTNILSRYSLGAAGLSKLWLGESQ